MRKIFVALGAFLFLFAFLVFPKTVNAKRRLPRAVSIKTGGSAPAARTSRGVTAKVRFRGDRLAIIVDFSNLGIASRISYNLSYTTRGTTQGAGGDISSSGGSTTRELIFGTCSGGVCRYDSGITKARFVVTTVLKNGVKIIKPFRLKVNR